MPSNTNPTRHGYIPRTHVRVTRSDGRNWSSMAVAYRELLGTAQELGHSEHMRLRASLRHTGIALDRHGFTWRSQVGTQAAGEEVISWTDFTFGVELEIIAPMSMHAVQDRMPRGWKVVYDGSLVGAPVGYTPMEVVSPILQGEEGIADLKRVMDQLKNDLGAKVYAKCGMHVHVGVRGMATPRVRKIAIAFLNGERHFDALVPPSRRQGNRYCNSNVSRVSSYEHQSLMTASSISAMATVMNGGSSHEHYTPYRYYKLNFQSFVRHGTLEFRQHAGTVESDKAAAWVRLVTGFCARAAAQPQQDIGARETFEQWIAANTDEEGVRYMTQRRAKFINTGIQREAA